MTVMLFKLAFAGIRSRLLASGLTIAIAGCCGRDDRARPGGALGGARPWQRTFAAANGAHVLALVPSEADARALGSAARRDRARRAGPARAGDRGGRGGADRVHLAGLTRRTTVNMPVLTAGSPLREGGIVLERSLAHALGIEVGDSLAVTSETGRSRLPCSGRRSYPASRATRAATPVWPGSPAPRSSGSNPIATVGVGRRRCDWRIPPRLRRSPSGRRQPFRRPRVRELSFETWQDQRDLALGDAQGTQVIVTMFTILLLIVAFVVVGILVGARASDQHREIGLLKAVGFTPRQVGASSRSSRPRLVSSRRSSASRSGLSLRPALRRPAPRRFLARQRSRRTPGTSSSLAVSSFRCCLREP